LVKTSNRQRERGRRQAKEKKEKDRDRKKDNISRQRFVITKYEVFYLNIPTGKEYTKTKVNGRGGGGGVESLLCGGGGLWGGVGGVGGVFFVVVLGSDWVSGSGGAATRP